MKTLNITANATLHARHAKPSAQHGAGGIACSATLRSRFPRRKTKATVARGLQLSNTDRVTVHSKFVVVDNATVETGSYNYSQAAARVNSENVLVLSNHPEIAKAYLDDWETVTSQGEPYRAR
ncbi:phospholipase D-like domain-containing protein [Paraburkholderia xenovorans]